MKYYIVNISSLLLVACLGLSISGCATNSAGLKSATNNKNIQHTHLANKCIEAVSHTHANGKAEHLHHYHTCEAETKNSNAHSHPSSSITGFTRHVHPNGGNKHTHVR
jgi:hypothetical protein